MKIRKLERIDGMFFGVCAGLGEYTGIDPTIVRVLWVVATIITMSAAFFLYVAMVFIVPKRVETEEGMPPVSRPPSSAQ